MTLLKKDINFKFTPIILLIFFPVSIILGPILVELSILIINIFYLVELKKKKIENELLNLKYFLIVWIYLLLNIFLSNNSENEFLRQIFYIRFIIFAFAVSYYILFPDVIKKIFYCWTIFFLIIFFDLFYEKINGFNLLGYTSPNQHRLVSFLKDELKIASILIGFCFLISSYFINSRFKKIGLLFIILTVFFIFISGERSNFLKSIFLVSIFLFIFFAKDLKKIILLITTLLIVLIVSLSFFKNTNSLYNQLYERLFFKDKDGIINVYKNITKFSPHIPHYITAIKIANHYPFFGAGIKNFRYICRDKRYQTDNYPTYKACSTHPHQIYFEIISETGYLGILFIIIPFFIFIFKSFKMYFINKNPILLSGIAYILINFIPILPSGSFFTNGNNFIFWLNIGFILAFSKVKKI